jgi:hypothetical protein
MTFRPARQHAVDEDGGEDAQPIVGGDEEPARQRNREQAERQRRAALRGAGEHRVHALEQGAQPSRADVAGAAEQAAAPGRVQLRPAEQALRADIEQQHQQHEADGVLIGRAVGQIAGAERLDQSEDHPPSAAPGVEPMPPSTAAVSAFTPGRKPIEAWAKP